MIGLSVNGEVSVVVFDSKITAMNFPGGQVYDYAKDRAQTCSRAAKMYAPSRSGRLRGSIRTDVRPGVSSVRARVRATARHAAWVHEGTLDKAPITAGGKMMHLSPHGPYGWAHARAVRGQNAQPFLMRALETTMATPYINVRGVI